MPFTTAQKQAILDHIYGGYDADSANWELKPEADLYIGLSSEDPGVDGTGFTEPVDGGSFKDGYSRVEVANTTTNWNNATAAEPSVKSNKTPIEFAACSGNAWPEVKWWGIFTDNNPASNPIDWAALDVNKTVGVGDEAKFSAGELKTQLQNPSV